MKCTVKKRMFTSDYYRVVVEEGERVDVVVHPDFDCLLRVTTEDGRTISTRAMVAHSRLTGFKQPPTMKTLERWVNDGVASSITGQKVEPDGYDQYGFPSWLIVMGLI